MAEAPAEHHNQFGQRIGPPLPGWTARPRPPRTPLQGRLCRLEALDAERHAKALHEAYAADSEGRNWTYLPYGPFPSAEIYAEVVRSVQTGEDPIFHAIIDLRSDTPVGVASYLRIDPGNGSIEVGHLSYSPALQRHPAATEAMYLMMRRVFDELGYRRYEWKCDSLNQPSRRAAERLGFCFEGIFRQAMVVKGRSRDSAWYSILDSEWPRLRGAFERWLDPANFDAAGKQRAGLAELRAAAR
jgi:RimJ/RimL family protein N-acetyltransferase